MGDRIAMASKEKIISKRRLIGLYITILPQTHHQELK
jgi:hypothetical protein